MNVYKITVVLFILSFASAVTLAQRNKKPVVPLASDSAQQTIKSSPAFAEVVLRRTELESVLEDLLVTYTDDFPKVKETRYELSLIERDSAKVLAVSGNSTNLSPALGKLMVRRAALATDLWSLQTKYGDEHPDVKRARRRVAIFDKAIGEIFP